MEEVMKAIVLTKYGSPDVLQFKEVAKPIPKDDEVLIEVHAASVNDWDWALVRGKPFMIRLLCGLLKPNVNIPGVDIAGQVEAVDRNVNKFQPGDEIFGDISECGFGGFAELPLALFTTALGLIFGYLREKDGSVLAPAFLHGLADLPLAFFD